MQKIRKTRLDEIDSSILSALQRNGKLSNVELAQKVGLSESACLRRVRLLEASGVIDRYVLLVEPGAVGLAGTVFVSVTLEGQQSVKLQAFEKSVIEIEEVMECYLMSGSADYLLRIACRDNNDFIQVHSRLTNLPAVQRVHSSFALRTVMKKTELPIRQTGNAN